MQRELIDFFRILFKTLPIKPGRRIFIKSDGLPYRHWDIYKPFKKLLKSLGIADKFSWKDIRHTTGTLLHLKGADPLAIKDQLRHTTIQTTEDFYIRADAEYQRSQIERLSLKKEASA